MKRQGRKFLRGAMAAGVTSLLLLVALPSSASDLEGALQVVGRDFVRVSNRLVRLDRGTLLEDMAGNILGPEELKPGVWVEVDFDQERGRAEKIRARVVR